MTNDPPLTPADAARAEGRVVIAPVTHRFDAGYVAVVLGDSGEVHRSKPDPDRCSRCGRRPDDRVHA